MHVGWGGDVPNYFVLHTSTDCDAISAVACMERASSQEDDGGRLIIFVILCFAALTHAAPVTMHMPVRRFVKL